ncbi:uncharacterized protein LOC108485239 [Gossypium arboreum]|uniref:uncharacterized protein LOC108485239 n=1 Tax=Gossypium arboreum TaxID=29729 RepID=UPI0008191396|nr:uncharacterized protein LOC108485239 [Gossypium arboreum]
MACSPDDYLRGVVSLLKEEAYNWWETIKTVVPTFPVKKSREEFSRATSMLERLRKKRSRQSDSRKFGRPAASMSSVQNAPQLKCQYCGRNHLGECWSKTGACYRCGSTDHFIRECPQLQRDEVE